MFLYPSFSVKPPRILLKLESSKHRNEIKNKNPNSAKNPRVN